MIKGLKKNRPQALADGISARVYFYNDFWLAHGEGGLISLDEGFVRKIGSTANFGIFTV